MYVILPLHLLVIWQSFECTLSPSSPYITWHPASSSLLDHSILFSSSKRALSSTSTSICLPFSAASIRLSTTLLCFASLYNVILIDTTSGLSAASCSMLRNGVMLSNGKDSSTSWFITLSSSLSPGSRA